MVENSRPKAATLSLLVLAAGALAGSCAPQTQPSVTPGPVAVAVGQAFDLVIAGTTDVHGHLRAWDYYTNEPERVRGLSRAATIVDSLRTANPGRVILLDAGDILQGTPLAYFASHDSASAPNPIIQAMNAMRYDAVAIGNHEYNYGVPYLDNAIAQARFPFLSDNTYKPSGAHAYPPWTILIREGLKVAVIGATTPGVMLWDADNVRGRVTLGDILPAVRQSVAEVRANGADVVIVTVHSGLDEPSSYDTVSTGVASENVAARIASEVAGIDVVLYGHSHKEMLEKTIGTTLLVQPKNWATSVSVVHLMVARSATGWSVGAKTAELIQAAGHDENSAILGVTQAAHEKTVAMFTTPIGTTDFAWRSDSARLKDTPIADFVLEAERKEAGTDLASVAVFAPDATIGPGPINGGQIAHIYPYDNTLKAVRITGRQLRDYLEFSARFYTGKLSASGLPETDRQIPGYNFDIVSGADYTIDLNKPIGSRITRLEYKGRPVNDSDSFTMALSNYRQSGGGGYAMLRGAPLVYDKQTEIRQLLIDEVRRRGALRPSDYFTPNWTLVPPGSAAASTSR